MDRKSLCANGAVICMFVLFIIIFLAKQEPHDAWEILDHIGEALLAICRS
jgi:hypothetical protein